MTHVFFVSIFKTHLECSGADFWSIFFFRSTSIFRCSWASSWDLSKALDFYSDIFRLSKSQICYKLIYLSPLDTFICEIWIHSASINDVIPFITQSMEIQRIKVEQLYTGVNFNKDIAMNNAVWNFFGPTFSLESPPP